MSVAAFRNDVRIPHAPKCWPTAKLPHAFDVALVAVTAPAAGAIALLHRPPVRNLMPADSGPHRHRSGNREGRTHAGMPQPAFPSRFRRLRILPRRNEKTRASFPFPAHGKKNFRSFARNNCVKASALEHSAPSSTPRRPRYRAQGLRAA